MSAAVKEARRRGWERQEPGWWTHDKHGGVVQGRNRRWAHYPLADRQLVREPVWHPTLIAAIDYAEGLRRWGGS